MFNKETLEGKWFRDIELPEPDDTTGYTEKVPPYKNYQWNEELNEWLLESDKEVLEESEIEEDKPEEG